MATNLLFQEGSDYIFNHWWLEVGCWKLDIPISHLSLLTSHMVLACSLYGVPALIFEFLTLQRISHSFIKAMKTLKTLGTGLAFIFAFGLACLAMYGIMWALKIP